MATSTNKLTKKQKKIIVVKPKRVIVIKPTGSSTNKTITVGSHTRKTKTGTCKVSSYSYTRKK